MIGVSCLDAHKKMGFFLQKNSLKITFESFSVLSKSQSAMVVYDDFSICLNVHRAKAP